MATSLPTTPSFELGGKTALVTGAGRGIGMAMAVALAKAGASVTLAARSADEIAALAEQLCAEGYKADTAVLDVTDIAATQAMIDARGPFNILINNAGTNRPKAFTEVLEDDYDAVLNLNLKATFFVAQAVARNLIQHHQSGSMIHISSQMGQVGGPNRSLYCASKWALEGLNKTLALDLAQYRIRSNCIAPTFIETPMTKPFFEDKAFLDSVLSKIKLGRLGVVEDLMGAVVFLASDASSLMTGSTLTVDGGWTAE